MQQKYILHRMEKYNLLSQKLEKNWLEFGNWERMYTLLFRPYKFKGVAGGGPGVPVTPPL